MSINRGFFANNAYYKFVDFNKAVLWKSRELSITPFIMKKILEKEPDKLIFIDQKKGEAWSFKLDEVIDSMELKKVGQEEQYYFPIGLKEVMDGDIHM